MKVFEDKFNYHDYFSSVSLAYFLRYPNPYAHHVLATDVIDRYVDPDTHRLHTTRLHLKKTKIPRGILMLLPKGIDGSDHSTQSYILERTVIDPHEGWMDAESRNLEWTGILSVVEKQRYQRLLASEEPGTRNGIPANQEHEQTAVFTKVTLLSRLGQDQFVSRMNAIDAEEEPPKGTSISSFSAAGIQRILESIGMKRTQDVVLKGKLGMTVVLERLRRGGVFCVLEGMRQDQETASGPKGP